MAPVSVVVWVLESVTDYTADLLWRNLAQDVEHDLRMDAYRHVQELELAYFEDLSTRELASVLDIPENTDDYVHRVGRTARAGRAGAGITFVAPGNNQEMSVIARELKLKDEFQADGLTLAAPQRVFSSKGRRSSMRRPQKRRF